MADLFRDDTKVARLLVRRLVAIKENAGSGTYHDADLVELSVCLDELANFDKALLGSIADASNVSVHTVRAIRASRTQPRYYNFMKVVDAAIQVAAEIAHLSTSSDVHPGSVMRQAGSGGWTADWVVKVEGDDVAILREALARLIESLRISNSTANEDSAINEITREELITILETALAMLKGPMVERGFLSRTGDWCKNLGSKVLEREAMSRVGSRLSDTVSAIENFLRGLG